MESCAACSKADVSLKSCKVCKLVKYCGADCQVAHRPAHKQACRKRAAELFDLKLFAQPPRKEECPICYGICNENTVPFAMLVFLAVPKKGIGDYLIGSTNTMILRQCLSWERASELGYDGAHYRLALAYFSGEGVQADTKKAIHHYQIAAIMGN
eukprot:scaffold73427_cov23-Cyclotella_meneghiniana.AAC.1